MRQDKAIQIKTMSDNIRLERIRHDKGRQYKTMHGSIRQYKAMQHNTI